MDYAGLSVAEAQARFFDANGMPADGGYAARRWAIKLGWLEIPVPNFRWRRRAVPIHDLHHIVTGYECSPIGEMEIAAWECAAGGFSNPFATLFCMPLVALGAPIAPTRVFTAFLIGRRSRTLYSMMPVPGFLDTSVNALRTRLLPAFRPAALPRDRLAFAWLMCRSLLALGLMLSPCIAGVAIVATLR